MPLTAYALMPGTSPCCIFSPSACSRTPAEEGPVPGDLSALWPLRSLDGSVVPSGRKGVDEDEPCDPAAEMSRHRTDHAAAPAVADEHDVLKIFGFDLRHHVRDYRVPWKRLCEGTVASTQHTDVILARKFTDLWLRPQR